MAEQEIKTDTPTQEVGVEEPKVETSQPPVEVDLITRVSQVKPPEAPAEAEKGVGSLEQEVQNLTTKEEVVEWAKKKEREWSSGYGKKFQDLADLRKTYETKLTEVTGWTPDRLKQELNKPDFVQAAQAVLKTGNQTGLSEEQYSALSETEKAELNQLKQKINILEQSNWQAVKTQQDAQLKTKFANYDPKIVDDITINLMQGKVQATREDLWKVIDYEKAVKRAYDLGKQDKIVENREKISGMTFEGGRNIETPSAVERQKGESIANFMRRSYGEHTKKTK